MLFLSSNNRSLWEAILLLRKLSHCRPPIQTSRRSLAVYVTGEGWTGALGTGDLTTNDNGPPDDDTPLIELVFPGYSIDGGSVENSEPPRILSAAAGWGHTAIVAQRKGGSDTCPRLFLCGRPHDFQSLLRIRRLPVFLRRPAVQQASRYNIAEETPSTSPSVVTRLVSFLAGEDLNFDDQKRNTILLSLAEMPLPGGDAPKQSSGGGSMNGAGKLLAASAGLTAVVGESGTLYTLGLNHRGQCGTGSMTNNVWTPTPVMGLSTSFPPEGRNELAQDRPIVSVALGLQHGLALDDKGNLYTWGKGERSQLGQGLGGERERKSSPYALRVTDFALPTSNGRRKHLSPRDARVRRMSAGLNHSVAVTMSNDVFVWGKNVAPQNPDQKGEHRKVVVDSPLPIPIQGLPSGLTVLDVSCGSHHTAILLEDGSVYAIGVATDNAEPILRDAVEIVPPGMIDMPCRQFEAHFDRTTIVGRDGAQVLEVQLWSHEELREDATVVPLWLDQLVRDEQEKGNSGKVRTIHRGWLHTVVVTDD